MRATTKMMITLLGMIGWFFCACKTSTPTVRVNESANQITVYTPANEHSALVDPSHSSAIDNSENVLKKKLANNPTDVSVMYDLANIYLMQNKLSEARALCRKALTYDLKNLHGKKLLGRIEFASENTDKAEIIFNSLGDDAAKDATVLNLLGLIAVKKNDYNQAFEMFNNSIKVDPENIAARMNLGTLYLKFAQYQNAGAHFERVLKLLPDHGDALLHLAIVKAHRGDYANAEILNKRVLKLEPRNQAARYNLAIAQFENGNLSDARSSVRDFLKIKSDDAKRRVAAEQFSAQIEAAIEKNQRLKKDAKERKVGQ